MSYRYFLFLSKAWLYWLLLSQTSLANAALSTTPYASATVVTINDIVVSVDAAHDVFVNGNIVLTGSGVPLSTAARTAAISGNFNLALSGHTVSTVNGLAIPATTPISAGSSSSLGVSLSSSNQAANAQQATPVVSDGIISTVTPAVESRTTANDAPISSGGAVTSGIGKPSGTGTERSQVTVVGIVTSAARSVIPTSTQASGGGGGGGGVIPVGGIVGGVAGLGGIPGPGVGSPVEPVPEGDNSALTQSVKVQSKSLASQSQQSPQPSTSLASKLSSSPSSASSDIGRSSTSATPASSGSITAASTSSHTSSCTDCCGTYDYRPTETPDPVDEDDNGELSKRQLRGRFYNKRQARGRTDYIKTVVGGCTVSAYKQKPDYPSPGNVVNEELAEPPNEKMAAFYSTATYWAVPTNPPNCGPPGWTFISTAELQPNGYAVGGTDDKSVNIDHVYEVSTLNEFFAAQINFMTRKTPKAVVCAGIQSLFDVTDGETGGTRLNTVYGQLSSFINPDFLGMDAGFNRLKGALWSDPLKIKPTDANDYKQQLANIGVVMSMAQHPKISFLFEQTNARIYQAFKTIDNIITEGNACNSAPASGGSPTASAAPASPTWASAYKAWILQKIASRNKVIQNRINTYTAALNREASNPSANTVEDYNTFIPTFNAAFPVADMGFPTPSLWPENILNMQKRQVNCESSQAAATSTTPIPSFVAILFGNSASPIATSPPTTPPQLSPTSIPPQNGIPLVKGKPPIAQPPTTTPIPSFVAILFGNSASPIATSPPTTPPQLSPTSISQQNGVPLVKGKPPIAQPPTTTTTTPPSPPQPIQTTTTPPSPQYPLNECRTHTDCWNMVCAGNTGAAICVPPPVEKKKKKRAINFDDPVAVVVEPGKCACKTG